MAKQTFDKGEDIDIRVHFTNPDDNNADLDPTSLSLVIRAPDAVVTTIPIGSITKESDGHYLYRLRLAQEGTYNWRWEAATPTKATVVIGSCDSKREVDF